MPHSSGGGHHGGGHHGGGHFSGGHSGSHSSHSSHSYHSSHNSHRPRHHFYYRNHGHVYDYYGEDYNSFSRDRDLSIFRVFIIGLCILFISLYLIYTLGSCAAPKKIQGTENYRIVIEDTEGVLGNTAKLSVSLRRFKEKTGITPAIITVSGKSLSTSLEVYAYKEYVRRFSSETYWLIVYTDNLSKTYRSGWAFEGMQGDDTDSILTSEMTSFFNSTLSLYLDSSSCSSPADAFSNAFDGLTTRLMKSEKLPDEFALFLILEIGLIIAFCWLIRKISREKGVTISDFSDNASFEPTITTQNRSSNSSLSSEDKPKVSSGFTLDMGEHYEKCLSCGMTYIKNTAKQCPFCGSKNE